MLIHVIGMEILQILTFLLLVRLAREIRLLRRELHRTCPKDGKRGEPAKPIPQLHHRAFY